MSSGGRFSNLELGDGGGRPAAKPGAGAPDELAEFRSSPGAPRQDVRFHLDDALRHELAGRHEKALTAYSAALGENPLRPDAWIGQLWMLLYLGEYPEARLWADKALRTFPDQPDLVALKSLALWRIGQRAAARDLNDTALEARQDGVQVWLARGEILLDVGGGAAGGCFQHAVDCARDKGMAYLRIGDAYLARGRYAAALGAFQEATRLLPESAWIWYGYGRAHQELGQARFARAALERAVQLAPQDPRYRAALRDRVGFGRRLTRFFRRWLGA